MESLGSRLVPTNASLVPFRGGGKVNRRGKGLVSNAIAWIHVHGVSCDVVVWTIRDLV